MWNTSSMRDTGMSAAIAKPHKVLDWLLTISRWATYGFWGGLLLIGIIHRLVTHFLQSRCLKATTDVEESQSIGTKNGRLDPTSLTTTIYPWLRSNVIIPAAFGSHHNRPLLWSTIPTRMETVVVVCFWLMNFILCCVSYYIFSPNL